nr:MAG TPA: hypothetical protein [Caudoviricetes sp.]
MGSDVRHVRGEAQKELVKSLKYLQARGGQGGRFGATGLR